MKKREAHTYIVWAIRGLLLLSIAINLTLTIYWLAQDAAPTTREVIDESVRRAEEMFWALVTLVLTFIPDYIERYQHVHLPNILGIIIVVFIFASIYLSEVFSLYVRPEFIWWDSLLHTISGVVVGFIGFISIYKLNSRYSMNLSPVLVSVFSFTFAVTIGVLWEIYEFMIDWFFQTDSQSWNLPETALQIGNPHQGAGLRDTMTDLIVDCVGASITSVISYFLYKYEKRKTLQMMREIFPEETIAARDR